MLDHRREDKSDQRREDEPNPMLDSDENRNLCRTNEELILLMDRTIRRFRPPKPEGVYDEADDVNRPKAGTDVGYVYIEEALKGPQMNPIWRRKILSQRPEDDDEELRKLVESRLKHYSPRIVDDYRAMHRYAALEEREYEKDIKATGGFEVGHYPYMARAGFNAIHRFYCPPDTDLPNHGIIHLCGLALGAIQVFNYKEGTIFYLVKVTKTMTLPAAGCWFFITFEASLPCYGDQLWTFEASVFEGIHRDIRVDSVRLKKMVAAPSSVIVDEPQPPSSVIC